MTSQVGPVRMTTIWCDAAVRAITAERAHRRELHDGPIQSLLAVDMELAVLRRRSRIATRQTWDAFTRSSRAKSQPCARCRERLPGMSDTSRSSTRVQPSAVSESTPAPWRTVSNGTCRHRRPERRELVQIVVEALA
jgi:hypothetical protein